MTRPKIGDNTTPLLEAMVIGVPNYVQEILAGLITVAAVAFDRLRHRCVA